MILVVCFSEAEATKGDTEEDEQLQKKKGEKGTSSFNRRLRRL